MILAVIVFIYTLYKYFSYSADCNPINNLPLEVNSLFNLIAMICSYTFWLIPVVVFFWPTKREVQHERRYRNVKKRWSNYSSSSAPTTTVQEEDDYGSDISSSDYGSEENDIVGDRHESSKNGIPKEVRSMSDDFELTRPVSKRLMKSEILAETNNGRAYSTLESSGDKSHKKSV